MLPEGAEALLDEHLEAIVADAAAAASAIEQLREEGSPQGAAAAESLADATSLARVYGRSARYGYFLRAVSARSSLSSVVCCAWSSASCLSSSDFSAACRASSAVPYT